MCIRDSNNTVAPNERTTTSLANYESDKEGIGERCTVSDHCARLVVTNYFSLLLRGSVFNMAIVYVTSFNAQTQRRGNNKFTTHVPDVRAYNGY